MRIDELSKREDKIKERRKNEIKWDVMRYDAMRKRMIIKYEL